MRWIDLAVFAQRDVLAVGVDAKPAAGARVKVGANSHPLSELGGISEIGEDCRRRGRDQLLDLQRLVY